MSATLIPLRSVLLNPFFGFLVEFGAVLLELVGNGRLNRVIGVGLDQEGLDEAQDGNDFVRWFPLVRTQKSEAHRPGIIIADIGVVDLGPETNHGGLERILVGEVDFKLEVSTLQRLVRKCMGDGQSADQRTA